MLVHRSQAKCSKKNVNSNRLERHSRNKLHTIYCRISCMANRFAAITLLHSFCGMHIQREQLQYISDTSGIEYAAVVQCLTESNYDIVFKKGVSEEDQLFTAEVTLYQVAAFALRLERFQCEQLIAFLAANAIMRTIDRKLLDRISHSLAISVYALQIFFFSVRCKSFTKIYDEMLKKASYSLENYFAIANFLHKGGKQHLEIKYRIGSLFNVNYFDRPEVEYILELEPGFLNNEMLVQLKGRGAELRFSCQLANWYEGNNERFWAFPECL